MASFVVVANQSANLYRLHAPVQRTLSTAGRCQQHHRAFSVC
jgi:hypothetical protein